MARHQNRRNSRLLSAPPQAAGDNPSETFLRTDELSRRFGLSESYWRKARMTGEGPKFLKCGRAVIYRLSDVLAWAQERTSTSESHAA